MGHYRFHKRNPLAYILDQIYPLQNIASYEESSFLLHKFHDINSKPNLEHRVIHLCLESVQFRDLHFGLLLSFSSGLVVIPEFQSRVSWCWKGDYPCQER